VVRLYLGDRATNPGPPKPAYSLTAADLQRLAGVYRDRLTGVPVTIVASNGALQLGRGQSDGLNVQRAEPLVPMSASEFVTADGRRWTFAPSGSARVVDAHGTVDDFEHVAEWKPTAPQLAGYAGTYHSDEAETTLVVEVQGDTLVVKRRPDTVIKLLPVYTNAFSAGSLGHVIFRRGGLSVVQDRVWDMRFNKAGAATSQ
jgi:hypothetical protein